MLIPSWAKSAAGVLLAVALVAVPSYCAGSSHAKATAASHERDALHKLGDSLTLRIHRDSVTFDSLRAAHRADSARTARLTQRVTIRTPTVIAVDTSDRHPGAPSAPPVLVTVPPEVTALIQAQAVTIAELRAELAVADSGWTHEKALRIEREREIALIQSQHSRFGVKTGVALGILGTVGAVWLAGKID